MKRLFLAAACIAIALPSVAQLASDEVPHDRTISRSEEIQQQLADSRYHAGPIRMRPIFGLHDTGYDSNVFGTLDEPVGDWGGTVSTGADLLLPFGRKMYLTGIVNPEYTWYSKIASRRMLGGTYGGSLLALFNHLSFEGGSTTSKSILPLSSEIERATPGRQTDIFARSELDVVQRLSVFGSAEQQRQRYEKGEEVVDFDPAQLERDETYVRGGIRYRPRSYFDVSVAMESGHADFVSATQNDNATHAIIAGIHYDRPRVFLNLSAGSRRMEARGPLSTFPSVTSPMGSYYGSLQLAAPLTLDAYGHRGLVYSLFGNTRYFDETRNGIGATWLVGRRMGFRAFTELGANRYAPVSGASLRRTDDITVVGGGLAYRLYRNVVVIFVASDTRYQSNVDAFDRSIFRVGATLSLSGNMF